MNRRTAIGADLVRVAARARGVLDRQAVRHIAAFLASREAVEGGFCGRGAGPDLYYTTFGMVAARVVGFRPDRRRLAAFLGRQAVSRLDLPHLAALVQCQRLLHPFGLPRPLGEAVAQALVAFRTPDGGFATEPGGASGTAYGLYLAVLAGEAMGREAPDRERLLSAGMGLLQAELGALVPGLNPLVSTALAVQALGGVLPLDAVRDALAGCRLPDGGYRAHARAAVSDLLSTAVAAFALRRLGAPLCAVAAAGTASFVQGLWDASGGFRGTAADAVPDCEYTLYALLALGALEP